MILLPILAIGLVWGSCSLALGQSSDEYKARIVVEPKADGRYVTIRLMCYAAEDVTVKYKLGVTKSGTSGKSNSYQSGTVRIQKGEEKCLSQSGLGISPGDKYEIMFEVFKGEKLVAYDRASYPPLE